MSAPRPIAYPPSCPTCGQAFRGPTACAKPACVAAAARAAATEHALGCLQVHVVEAQVVFERQPLPGVWEPVAICMSAEGAQLVASQMARAFLAVNNPKPVRVRVEALRP